MCVREREIITSHFISALRRRSLSRSLSRSVSGFGDTWRGVGTTLLRGTRRLGEVEQGSGASGVATPVKERDR